MYQSGFGAGAGFLVSFGLVEPLPQTGSLWWVARLVLDVAGTLFGCYLLCCVVLVVAAVTTRTMAAILAAGQAASRAASEAASETASRGDVPRGYL